MSHLIKMYAVCKFSYFLSLVLKELIGKALNLHVFALEMVLKVMAMAFLYTF